MTTPTSFRMATPPESSDTRRWREGSGVFDDGCEELAEVGVRAVEIDATEGPPAA